MFWILNLLLLAGAVAGMAAEPVKFPTLRSGSTVYSNVTVLSSSATDLYIQHQSGVVNLKLRYVEPSVQQRFGYNDLAAREAEKQLEERDAQFQAALATPAPLPSAPARTSETSVSDPLTPASLLNRPAPPLKGLQWLGAAPTGLSNQVTLVYFWEPWSAPSRRWMAPLQGLRAKFPGTALIAVSRSPEADQRSSEVKPDGPRALDAQGQFGNAAGVTSVPHLLVIDRTGKVRYNGHPGGITEEFLQGM